MEYDKIKAKLEKSNQAQLLKAYDRADEITKKKLEEQFERIDFEKINELYKITKNEINFSIKF